MHKIAIATILIYLISHLIYTVVMVRKLNAENKRKQQLFENKFKPKYTKKI
jgi:Na+-driven multidrug efflux pump